MAHPTGEASIARRARDGRDIHRVEPGHRDAYCLCFARPPGPLRGAKHDPRVPKNAPTTGPLANAPNLVRIGNPSTPINQRQQLLHVYSHPYKPSRH